MIVRVCQLTRGCIFVKNGTTYRVFQTDDVSIHSNNWNLEMGVHRGSHVILGRKSKERVELLSGNILIYEQETKDQRPGSL